MLRLAEQEQQVHIDARQAPQLARPQREVRCIDDVCRAGDIRDRSVELFGDAAIAAPQAVSQRPAVDTKQNRGALQVAVRPGLEELLFDLHPLANGPPEASPLGTPEIGISADCTPLLDLARV